MAEVADPSRAVFNFHCPPLELQPGHLPEARRLRSGRRPVDGERTAGHYGAGSQAVADALLAYQPAVGLHGHIHESRGMIDYGRTPAYNPGSEYGEGVLRGLIVAISGR